MHAEGTLVIFPEAAAEGLAERLGRLVDFLQKEMRRIPTIDIAGRYFWSNPLVGVDRERRSVIADST